MLVLQLVLAIPPAQRIKRQYQEEPDQVNNSQAISFTWYDEIEWHGTGRMNAFAEFMTPGQKQDHGQQMQYIKMQDIEKERNPAKHSNELRESGFCLTCPGKEQKGGSNSNTHE